jgi:hypothetical protein
MAGRVLNNNMTENLGAKNKPLPVSCERVESPYALMGIPDGDGYTSFFLIKREDVEDWKHAYNGSNDPKGYQEVEFDDYSEFFPWSQQK